MAITDTEFADQMAPMLDEMLSGTAMAAEAWFKVMSLMDMHERGMKSGEYEKGWLQIVNSLSLITTIICSLSGGLASSDSANAKSLLKRALDLNDHFIDNLVALRRLRR